MSNIPGLTVKVVNGRKVIDGEAKPMDDSGFDVTVDSRQAAENARAIDRGYKQLQRADVMGMLREPSQQLQAEFAANSERPQTASAIKGQLQFHLDLAQRAEKDIAAGKNPMVIDDYNAATGRGNGTEFKTLKPRRPQ